VQPTWALAGSIGFLIIFSSIFAVNAAWQHADASRRATRVTSLLYLTPVFAVRLEWLLFAVVPSPLTMLGLRWPCTGVSARRLAPERN